ASLHRWQVSTVQINDECRYGHRHQTINKRCAMPCYSFLLCASPVKTLLFHKTRLFRSTYYSWSKFDRLFDRQRLSNSLLLSCRFVHQVDQPPHHKLAVGYVGIYTNTDRNSVYELV